jgi:hypothetical protein
MILSINQISYDVPIEYEMEINMPKYRKFRLYELMLPYVS